MNVRDVCMMVAAMGMAQAHAQGLNPMPERPAVPVQVVCFQQDGERQLMRASVADVADSRAIEVRSGASSRSVDLADIDSIDVTGPVNRMNRFAWATLKTRSGEEHSVGILLRSADNTLVLDGYTADGAPASIDLLSCKRVVFRTSTLKAGT
jgi:hypothetical protein